MSYCVNCGVQLHDTAAFCPLCHTPVVNPAKPVDTVSPKPFPQERREVQPASKWELALLISAMFGSVAVCCGILNLFLRKDQPWSIYVIGAAVMLWVWFVPPLLCRPGARTRLVADILAIAAYLLVIALHLDGWSWYWRLALPLVLLLGVLLFGLVCLILERRRSVLSSAILVIGAVGIFLVGVELFGDLYFYGNWKPGWSLVVLFSGIAMIVPLLVVRYVPALREESRRRFHM